MHALSVFTFLFLSAFQVKAELIDPEMARRCQKIAEIYSHCFAQAPFEISQNNFLFHVQGRSITMPCTDGIQRGFYDRAKHMDIASILQTLYTPGPLPIPTHQDPGRLRAEPLLMSVYGDSEANVRTNLRWTRFLNSNVLFNKNNGAAKALERVGRELQVAIQTDSVLADELLQWKTVGNMYSRVSRGTFVWRLIAGTTFLSAHAFGTAIDLIPVENGLPEYWRWNLATTAPEESIVNFPLPHRISSFPEKVIEIFESNGFIWGGKWWHFDSMHFEYRPEMFATPPMACDPI